ncbi:MAG: NUDIX hydrolase [Chlorobium phaeobacteroides]|uniref:NUDIX hydrolase n=1 Tax=Chlorobium phaeobacteroides (strain BS1) TaxID=331678 RepID=B3EJS9_CHLPB|nr:NUDIX hydrolase [Chlorobium phaeobacteroides]
MVKATVTAILSPSAIKRDTVLLTRRAVEPFRDFWCFPGGHIDRGETAKNAIIREAAEETGLELQSPVFLGYCDEIFPALGFHAVVLMFYGTARGELLPQPGEVSDIAWFSVREARSLTLAFNHQEVLTRYENHLDSL